MSDASRVPVQPGVLAEMGKAYFPFSLGSKFEKIGTDDVDTMDIIHGQELSAMQQVMEFAGPLSKMYATPEDLWNELKVFTDFPGNNRFFELNDGVHYNHSLVLHPKIGSNKMYIYKNDIFLYLQSKILEMEPKLNNRLALMILAKFFRFHETKLQDTCEFVEFKKRAFKKLDKELQKTIQDMKTNIQGVASENLNAEKMILLFKKLVPVQEVVPLHENGDRAEKGYCSALSGIINNLFEDTVSQETCALMYSHLSKILPTLEKIMNTRKDWFNSTERRVCTLGYMMENLGRSGMVLPARKSKPVFRVFQDGGYSFVMAKEIEAYMQTIMPSQIPEDEVVGTLGFKSAMEHLEEYGVDPEDVAFITVPIIRAKHSAVPVTTPNGHFCKLAIDCFVELFHDLIFGIKAFQGVPPNTHDDSLELLRDVFFTDEDNLYFIESDHMAIVYELMIERMSQEEEGRDIREYSNGFTQEDLLKEIQYLQLDTYVPNIKDYVSTVYSTLPDVKGTPEMYDAIGNCVMLALFKRNPRMAGFVHKQRGCGRIAGFRCARCKNEMKKRLKEKKEAEAFMKHVYKSDNEESEGEEDVENENLNPNPPAKVKFEDKGGFIVMTREMQ
ncbi:unnamed protein product [Caenorhabditis nigoni]